MGRHRRGDNASAPDAATPVRRTRGPGKHRRRGAPPVRTGLLGATAAMAVGTLAVTSGLIPGLSAEYTIDGLPGPNGVYASDAPRTHAPDASPSASPGREPAASRSTPPGENTPSRSPGKSGAGSSAPSDGPERSTEPTPSRSSPRTGGVPEKPSTEPSSKPDGPRPTTVPDSGAVAEAEVLELVNEERSRAGCRPVTADASLAELADEFSRDMAEEGFFSHVGPDGTTPWDRAEAAGVDNLGAENIARGQTDARSVMETWMDSPGHRANILNCDYTVMGVGAHFGEGGPWWTQSFGF